jgi:antitoxin component YwqK of YwqJK toxin-antitoxin module
MKKLIKLISILFSAIMILSSCGFLDSDRKKPRVKNYDKQERHFQQKNDTTYFKGKPYTGIAESYFHNGQLKESQSFRKGEKDGDYEQYWLTGHLSTKGVYKANKKEGLWHHFFDSGELSAIQTYKDGKLDGDYEHYWLTGHLRTKGVYKANEKEGTWYHYYDNGDLSIKETYKKGNLHGNYEKYLGGFEDYYNLTSSPIEVGVYKDGKKDGIWVYYEDDGERIDSSKKVTYKEGVLHGDIEHYGLIGLTMRGAYKNDRKDGVWYYYSSPLDGWWKRETYLNGKLVEHYLADYKLFDDDNLSLDEVSILRKNFIEGTGQRGYSVHSNHRFTMNFNAPYVDKKRKPEPVWVEDGYQRRYFINSENVFSQRRIVNGRIVEKIYFHPDGRIYNITEFVNNKKHGRVKYVDLDNYVILEGRFSNGMIVGYWNTPVFGRFNTHDVNLKNQYPGVVGQIQTFTNFYSFDRETRGFIMR